MSHCRLVFQIIGRNRPLFDAETSSTMMLQTPGRSKSKHGNNYSNIPSYTLLSHQSQPNLLKQIIRHACETYLLAPAPLCWDLRVAQCLLPRLCVCGRLATSRMYENVYSFTCLYSVEMYVCVYVAIVTCYVLMLGLTMGDTQDSSLLPFFDFMLLVVRSCLATRIMASRRNRCKRIWYAPYCSPRWHTCADDL